MVVFSNQTYKKMKKCRRDDLLIIVIFYILCFSSVIIQDVLCLRDVQLVIFPSIVQRGLSVTLLCQYELEGDPLYSVKWYRGIHEFYRYSPSERQPTKIFPFRGINVDESHSNSTQVVLRDVGFNLAGNFSCEVTTDAPSFSNRFVSQQMYVIALPVNRPVINTNRAIYEPGDILKANCTSPPSKPPADLTFHINGHPIPIEKVIHRRAWDNDTTTFGELQWSIASISIHLQAFHFLTKLNPKKDENDIYSRISNPNTEFLHISCTAQLQHSEYHETTILKVASKIGEPIHQRVMSDSSNNISITSIMSTFNFKSLLTLILIKELLIYI